MLPCTGRNATTGPQDYRTAPYRCFSTRYFGKNDQARQMEPKNPKTRTHKSHNSSQVDGGQPCATVFPLVNPLDPGAPPQPDPAPRSSIPSALSAAPQSSPALHNALPSPAQRRCAGADRERGHLRLREATHFHQRFQSHGRDGLRKSAGPEPRRQLVISGLGCRRARVGLQMRCGPFSPPPPEHSRCFPGPLLLLGAAMKVADSPTPHLDPGARSPLRHRVQFQSPASARLRCKFEGSEKSRWRGGSRLHRGRGVIAAPQNFGGGGPGPGAELTASIDRPLRDLGRRREGPRPSKSTAPAVPGRSLWEGGCHGTCSPP